MSFKEKKSTKLSYLIRIPDNIDDLKNTFEVNIIPYSFKHTNFSLIKVNDFVNIEFDVLGKYIERLNNNLK